MSDGGRGRASLGMEVWKPSQKWSAQRSAVRSIAWLDARVASMCSVESPYLFCRAFDNDADVIVDSSLNGFAVVVDPPSVIVSARKIEAVITYRWLHIDVQVVSMPSHLRVSEANSFAFRKF